MFWMPTLYLFVAKTFLAGLDFQHKRVGVKSQTVQFFQSLYLNNTFFIEVLLIDVAALKDQQFYCDGGIKVAGKSKYDVLHCNILEHI